MSGGPLSLGALRLSNPFVQAALSGYSDAPMRRLARRFGAAYALAEVMLDRFALEAKGRGRTGHHFRLTDDDHPVGGQLMGADPLQFGPAALRLVAAGFDVIDINFGCPVKSALGGCRGGYHLGQPQVALEIISRVREAVPPAIPVTVKMRRGIDDSAESRDRFYEILAGAFERGIAAATVHGRTVEQKYIGPSRWSFLREVKQWAGERCIIGSGDLFTPADCLRMLRETGVNGVSIARGAIGNPWIFARCLALWHGEPLPPVPSVREQREVLESHQALLAESYGAAPWLSQLRKFSVKYARWHPAQITVRNDFAVVRDVAGWEQVLNRHYSHDAPGFDADQVPLSPVEEAATDCGSGV